MRRKKVGMKLEEQLEGVACMSDTYDLYNEL
jgi:hypothetical protein